jgi:hypothetical protein
VRSCAVKQGLIVKNKSSAEERGIHKTMMIALSGLINTHTKVILVKLLAKYLISYHLFSFRKSVQDYIIHTYMEIIIFDGIKG